MAQARTGGASWGGKGLAGGWHWRGVAVREGQGTETVLALIGLEGSLCHKPVIVHCHTRFPTHQAEAVGFSAVGRSTVSAGGLSSCLTAGEGKERGGGEVVKWGSGEVEKRGGGGHVRPHPMPLWAAPSAPPLLRRQFLSCRTPIPTSKQIPHLGACTPERDR